MNNPMLARIRKAAQKGLIATRSEEPFDPDQARLVDRDRSVSERAALFTERAASSGARVWRAEDSGHLQSILASLLSSDRCVALAGEVEPQLLPQDGGRILSAPFDKKDLFAVDAAVTDAALGVAETGSVLLEASGDQARLLSLTASTHIVLLPMHRIIPDLLDLQERRDASNSLGFTLITGPSKTADIEIQLVKGVHGPARLHIILIPPNKNHDC